MSTLTEIPPVIFGGSAIIDVVRANGWNVWHDAFDLASGFGDSWPAFVKGVLPDLVPVFEDEIGEQFGNDDVSQALAARGLVPCPPSDAFRLAASCSFRALAEAVKATGASGELLPRQIVLWHEPLPNRFGVRRRLCLSAGAAGDGVFHVDAGPEMRWRYVSPTFRTATVFLARPSLAQASRSRLRPVAKVLAGQNLAAA